MSSYAILEVGGLSLNALGVMGLFAFRMPYRIRTGGSSYYVSSNTDARELRWEKWFSRLGTASLVFAVSGSILQIVAVWVQQAN
jgi:hypothetical protein